MANEKISEFAVDSAIEGVDGLAAMRVTSGTNLPVQFGNVAVPGFAFTLENILKTKTDRTDADPNNWSAVPSNTIPSSGTNDPDEGIMWKKATGENVIHMYQGNSGSQNLYFENKYQLGQLRSGILFLNQSDWQVIQDGNNSTLYMENKRNGAGYGVKIQSGTDVSTAADFLINARGTNANLDVFSGKNINIKSGKGTGGQQAGDVVITLGTTNPTVNQVLAAKDTNGTLEWQDNLQYTLDTSAQGSTDVKLELKDNAATPAVVGSLIFEKGNGIDLVSNLTPGVNGSFSIEVDLRNNNGVNTSGLFFDTSFSDQLAVQLIPQGGIYFTTLNNPGLGVDLTATSIVGDLPINKGGTGASTAAAARTNLDVDKAGTDNSTNVTLDTSNYDYLSITGQEIELLAIDLETDVSGELPIANGGTGAGTAADARANLEVDIAGTDNSTPVTLAGTPDYITISGQTITRNQIDLASDVSGVLPVNNGGAVPKAFQTLLDASTNTTWTVKNGYNAKIDFDAASSNSYDFTSSTITATDGDYGTLVVINGSTAGTITFPNNSMFVGGNSPTPTDDGIDIYSFVYDGTNYYWTYGLDNKA